MELDGTPFGIGPRSRRFALHAEDGVVRKLHIEAPRESRVFSAGAMLDAVAS